MGLLTLLIEILRIDIMTQDILNFKILKLLGVDLMEHDMICMWKISGKELGGFLRLGLGRHLTLNFFVTKNFKILKSQS